MKNGKAALISLGLVFALAGCGKTSYNGYNIDPKTGICTLSGFGASPGKVGSAYTTCVPCTPEVLKLVDQDNLKALRDEGIKPVACVLGQ